MKTNYNYWKDMATAAMVGAFVTLVIGVFLSEIYLMPLIDELLK